MKSPVENEDLQYGQLEPDSYLAFMGAIDILVVLGSLLWWVLVTLPLAIYRRLRRNGRHRV